MSSYYVQFVSVDGAGRFRSGPYHDSEEIQHLTPKAAIDFAEQRQADSDERCNPYGYRYNVLEVPPQGESRRIYTTKSNPRRESETLAEYRRRRFAS